jgi:hypothetical protein
MEKVNEPSDYEICSYNNMKMLKYRDIVAELRIKELDIYIDNEHF